MFHAVSKGKSSHLMKASAQRRKSRVQIQNEKLQEQQKQAEIAEKMRRFDQMQQEAAAAQENLNQLSGMKQQVDQMFEQGYIFKNPDGSLALANSEEQRLLIAESAAKQPRAPDQLNLLFAQADGRNLGEAFNEAAVPGDLEVEY
jgi:hypothetical protein